VKLWSYSDLMGLRIIYWLRQVKEASDGAEVPRTTMPTVRRVLAQLQSVLPGPPKTTEFEVEVEV